MDWKPITELRSVTGRMGSHSVTCHPAQVNAPRNKLCNLLYEQFAVCWTIYRVVVRYIKSTPNRCQCDLGFNDRSRELSHSPQMVGFGFSCFSAPWAQNAARSTGVGLRLLQVFSHQTKIYYCASDIIHVCIIIYELCFLGHTETLFANSCHVSLGWCRTRSLHSS